MRWYAGEPGRPIVLLADGVSSFITEQVFTQDGGWTEIWREHRLRCSSSARDPALMLVPSLLHCAFERRIISEQFGT
jgi:hypothetical protein